MELKTEEAKYFIDNEETETLNIKQIILNTELQVRNCLDKHLIAKYSRAMSNGASFPPVMVANVEGKLFLIDGFHRLYAARDLGACEISALIKPMTLKEAKVSASLANLTHAKPLNSSEKKNAFILFIKGSGYKDKYGNLFSYRELAVKLYGLASPASLHRWMWKYFPSIAAQMACENPTGNINAESEWLQRADQQHLHNAKEAIRSVSDNFKSLEDLIYRHEIYTLIKELEADLAKHPMEQPEF